MSEGRLRKTALGHIASRASERVTGVPSPERAVKARWSPALPHSSMGWLTDAFAVEGSRQRLPADLALALGVIECFGKFD